MLADGLPTWDEAETSAYAEEKELNPEVEYEPYSGFWENGFSAAWTAALMWIDTLARALEEEMLMSHEGGFKEHWDLVDRIKRGILRPY